MVFFLRCRLFFIFPALAFIAHMAGDYYITMVNMYLSSRNFNPAARNIFHPESNNRDDN
jgi:hypothetical protein